MLEPVRELELVLEQVPVLAWRLPFLLLLSLQQPSIKELPESNENDSMRGDPGVTMSAISTTLVNVPFQQQPENLSGRRKKKKKQRG